jgi:hypothetical protein
MHALMIVNGTKDPFPGLSSATPRGQIPVPKAVVAAIWRFSPGSQTTLPGLASADYVKRRVQADTDEE